MQLVIHRNQQCIDIGSGHMVILFGTVDPLKIQQIKFVSVGFGDLFQVLFGENLVFCLPYGRKIRKIQCHLVVKKRWCFQTGQCGQWLVITGSPQMTDKFFNGLRRGQQVDIQL